MIAPTPKGITLTMYTHGSAKLLKLYAGVTRYDVAIGDTVSSFGGVEGQPVFISFAGVGSEVADEIAGKIKETADCKVMFLKTEEYSQRELSAYISAENKQVCYE